MADNVILNLGSGGDTVAADEISGAKYTRCKITLGADGVSDGDVSSAVPMPVGNSPATAFSGYGQTSIGVAAVQLTSKAAVRGVIVKALSGNTGKIYVGSDGSVTTSNGYELIAGDGVCLPLNNLNLVWCISDIAAQGVSWAVV